MKEIHFTDGSVRTIYPSGEEETQLPDGVRVKMRSGDSFGAAAGASANGFETASANRSGNTSEPLNTPRPSAAAVLSPNPNEQQVVERIYEFPDGQREVHTSEFKVLLLYCTVPMFMFSCCFRTILLMLYDYIDYIDE